MEKNKNEFVGIGNILNIDGLDMIRGLTNAGQDVGTLCRDEAD
jgi:hypothetical protein